MSAFGFDPSIILQGRPSTLSDMLEPVQRFQAMQQGQQMHQAQLADLMRRQQQEQTIADIYRANAGNMEALPGAFGQAGLGREAFAAQEHLSQLHQRDAQSKKSMQDGLRESAELMGRAFRGVKDQSGVDAALAVLRSAGVPENHIAMLPQQYNEQTAPMFERFAALGTPSARALSPEEEEARLARAEYERAKAKALGQGPKAPDPLKQETQRLRNEKLKRELGEGDQPNKLLALDEYDLRPGFDLKPEIAEKLRDAQAQTRTMTKNVDELMTLYRTHGNSVLPGKARARMEAVARHLQLKSKGKTMFELGVIAGPDMDLLNGVIPVPTKKDATIADFFSGGGDSSETMERLRVMREQLGENFHSAATTRGYLKKAAKQKTSAVEPASWNDADEARLQELERKAGGK